MRGTTIVAFRGLQRRRARHALKTIGIVLGVANIFGVLVTNASTGRSLEQQFRFFSGNADLVATSNVSLTIDAATLANLSRTPGLETMVKATQHIPIDGKTNSQQRVGASSGVSLLGIDAVGMNMLNKDVIRGRVFRAGRAEVVIQRAAARILRTRVGDIVSVPIARKRFTVIGIVDGNLQDAAFGSATSGGLAFTSLEALADTPEVRGVHQVYMFLKKEISPNLWVAEQQAAFPNLDFKYSAVPHETRRFLEVLRGTLAGSASVTLFVGAFLIYVAFSMTLAERTRLYGTLHALGATNWQIVRGILVEALVLGSIATLTGLALGIGVGAGILRAVSALLELTAPRLVIAPQAVILTVVVGVTATLVASVLPAVRAGRLNPVEALRNLPTVGPARRMGWRSGALLLAGATGWGLLRHPSPSAATDPLNLIVLLSALLGSVLLVPLLLPLFARTIRLATRWLAPRLGEIPASHLERERSQSGHTLSLVMVALAMMLTLAATHSSMQRGLDQWIDKRFGADLLVIAPTLTHVPLTRVRSIEEVSGATPVALGQVIVTKPVAAGSANLVLIDPNSFFDIAGFPWVQGDDERARVALLRGGNVLLPAGLATRLGVRNGDELTILPGSPSPHLFGPLNQLPASRPPGDQLRRPHTMTVAGIYSSFGTSAEVGIVASFADGRRGLMTHVNPSILYVNLTSLAHEAHVRTTIDQLFVEAYLSQFQDESVPQFSGSPHFVSGSQLKKEARRELASYVGLVFGILLIAVVIGSLGLANTISASVLQRYREIGMLHAIGATPQDVARMIVLEAVVLLSAAFALAVTLGSILATIVVRSASASLGFAVEYVYPWIWLPALAGGTFLIVLTAAMLPARRASRITPIEALRHD